MSPRVAAIADGGLVGDKHQFIQWVVQQSLEVFPGVVVLQTGWDGQTLQRAASLEDTGIDLSECLRQHEAFKRRAVEEQVIGQFVCILNGLPCPLDAPALVQVVSLVVVLHDAGVVEVQVAQVAVGGNSAAVIAVVTSQVADGPEVEVVQWTVYYQ